MRELPNPRPIFVGGTGRSGTTVFYRALGKNRHIHIFPNEMRFLIDPGGLMDLVDACTVRYSPTRAREALHAFETMMRVYLTVPERPPYRGFDLPGWLGGQYYWDRLDRFCAEFSQIEYEGISWQVEAQNEGRLVEWAKTLQRVYRPLLSRNSAPFRLELPRETLKVVKPFVNRARAIDLATEFVGDLFGHAARVEGKNTWSEKTPHSLFHLDFIWEMFPHGLFVHIKRDPRGVVYSMIRSSWKRAPSGVHGACLLLKNMYERWFQLRRELPLNNRSFLEFKIEEIAREPRAALRCVTEEAGVEDAFDDLPNFDPERLNEWRSGMSKEDLATTMRLIGPFVEAMGYRT